MNLWAMSWRLCRYRPWTAALGTALWVIFHATVFFTGLVLQAVFNGAAGNGGSGLGVYALVGVFVGIEVGRFVCFFGAWYSWHRSWFIISSLLRGNMLARLLGVAEGPASHLPRSSGESVTRFRDDVDDVMWFIDIHLDVIGAVLFSVGAIVVMVRIDAILTLAAVAPLGAVAVGNRVLTGRLRALRRTYRLATAVTTSFLGDLFESILAVRAAGAERNITGRLGQLNGRRTAAAVRDNTAREALISFNVASVDVAIGVVLLAAAGAMRKGSFTVGDLVLFTTYMEGLSAVPRRLGRLLAFRRHAQVAVERMQPLAGGGLAELSQPLPLYLKEPPPPVPPRTDPPALRRLRAEGLTALYPTTGRGIDEVDLVVEAGSVTVIAGPVGSGKTTLLRALLGLVPAAAGRIYWNDEPVEDPGRFLVPPVVAYTPQVPRLFSETLEDNLGLGHAASPERLEEALYASAFDQDVREMPDGLATLLGPRGVRLSGGQLQRAATARAVRTGAPLLVVDDPSSALDAHTEELMWDRLLSRPGRALLVVSNRAEIITRARHAVVLDGGRVVASGPGPEVAAAAAS